MDARLEETSVFLCEKALELERLLRIRLRQVSVNSAAQQERNMVFRLMKSKKKELVKELMELKVPDEGEDLLRERLKIEKDLAEEKGNLMPGPGENLDALIASCCGKDILGDGYKRLEAFEKLNSLVRKIGILLPESHRVSEENFRTQAACCLLSRTFSSYLQIVHI